MDDLLKLVGKTVAEVEVDAMDEYGSARRVVIRFTDVTFPDGGRVMTVPEILSELLGHYAYDTGSRDSGVHDPKRQVELAAMWRVAIQQDSYRANEARWFRERFLSDEAVAAGYGVGDVRSFSDWLENTL